MGFASIVLGLVPICLYRLHRPAVVPDPEPGPELYSSGIWVVVGGFLGYVLLRVGLYLNWRSKGSAG
jgi:hypothetical protein